MNDINEIYFNLLLDKSKSSESKPIILAEPEKGIESNVICIPIASDEDLKSVNIIRYEELDDNFTPLLQNYSYKLVKMQAGLGTSVERSDLIKKIENRESLGAKGTDLYFEVMGKWNSIAKIQALQAKKISEAGIFKEVIYKNLVNEETIDALEFAEKEIENTDKFKIDNVYFQNQMPTLDSDNNLTQERTAPAGHGFVGAAVLIDIFNNSNREEIIAIGNGEDLGSTPDTKIVDIMVRKNIPIIMMTTTKTEADKKGGQISIVKGKPDFVTIVEKAQAEKAGQLTYFEELGLRSEDRESLFNTNIVLINRKALKELMDKFLGDYSQGEFLNTIAPDVIFNVKEQDGKKFTQLESALGSVVLNLDKYFRVNFNTPLITFLNLNKDDRKKFFMPIKTRDDYNEIVEKFYVDETFRLKPKK